MLPIISNMIYLSQIVSLLCLSIFAFSQNSNRNITQIDSTLNSATFYRDTSNNSIRIFGQGGYAPTAFSRKDSLFEIKYKITYVLYGCESPYTNEEMKEYNLEVGKFLDKHFGTVWRKELHTDVINLK